MRSGRWWSWALVAALVASACWGDSDGGSSSSDGRASVSPAAHRTTSRLRDRPLPERVPYRETPDGVTLGDPEFDPLPGASADFGRLGGAAYQIEIPDEWNGGLVMWMHGFGEFEPQANVAPPDFRRYLTANGYAWAASSYSTTSLIPQRGADETAALWDYFVREHGRPDWTYASGLSMGGWSAHIAAERYGDRYDGALALCGAVGTVPALRISAEYFIAGAYVAGVRQPDYDASRDIGQLVDGRIRPALDDPDRRALFDRIMVDLTGGPRAFAVEGIHDEEDTNFERASLIVAARLAPPRETPYRLGPDSPVSSEAFNRDAIVIPTSDAYDEFSAGMEVTGDLAMPLITLHTTGDGQVPINQAQILRDRVQAAGRSDRLVQRVIEDPGHCGFSTSEQEAAFQALVDWVERGVKPDGTDLDVDDLTRLAHTFELAPRSAAGQGESQVTIRGRSSLDDGHLDARWMGAVVRRHGLVTPCNVTLPPSNNGRYEIAVYNDEASAGCGGPGSDVLLWTYAGDTKLYATEAVPWPSTDSVTFDAAFTTTDPLGAAPAVTEFSGEVYDDAARRYEAGSRVEAYVSSTLCGVASIRSSGSYILSVVGPDSLPGCTAGERITFVVNGAPATETVANSPEQSTHLDLTVPTPTDTRG
jgi:pimeloyl-ACP methyl ester carboxylesterase